MENPSFHTNKFKKMLETKWLGRSFRFFDEIDSTNTFLKKLPVNELQHGDVVLANAQVKGRGQHQKSWITEPGRNLTFTMAFKPNRADRFTLLTLSLAYGAMTVLQKYSDEKLQLKWPNDLMAGSKKIGGILTECAFMGTRPERVLIGMGLNILQEEFPDDIYESATSLSHITNTELNREDIFAQLLNVFEGFYEKWESGDPELHKLISKNLVGFGEWVRLKIDDQLTDKRFKFLGVNEKGELLVINDNLELNTFSHEQIRIITGNESISKISS